MTQDINTTVQNLQKNFLELHSLFDLNMIANQAFSLSDFFSRISEFIENSLNLEKLHFFVNNNGIFQTKFLVGNQVNTIAFDAENAPFLADDDNSLIKVTNKQGEVTYKAFWETYNLNRLNCRYMKAFYQENVPICICSISSKKDNTEFTDEELAYLEKLLASVEPILIKFMRQKEQEKQITTLNKTLHNLSILYNISQAVNFIDDLKGLVQVILDKAIDTIEAEKGSLMLYDISDNTLQVKVVYGLQDKKAEFDINNGLIECTKLKANEGIAGKVFAEKKAIITNLGAKDPRFAKTDLDSGISSLLCVPLVAKGESIGVINITNKKNGKLFNKQDLEFIEALANQAAIAVDNAKLYELATKDGLTKLYIIRHFKSLLETELKRMSRYNHVLTLLMMDIDNFKKVNDTYGHLTGDMVLKEIAAAIQSTIRHIDIAARYGGEEFVVVLPETAARNAKIIAERIRVNVSKIEIKIDENNSVRPTVSIGIAEFPNIDEPNMTCLIECADKALYQAKNNGKNCIYEYREGEFFRCTE